MNSSNRRWIGVLILLAAIGGIAYLGASRSSAQQPAAMTPDALGFTRALSTQVLTLNVEKQRGEPRIVNAKVKFERPVIAYWLTVVGYDVKFGGTTEKQINRLLFSVDPYAKVINGNELQVSGKLGIRDGSGDWDDTYEGTITVAVTAVLAEK